MKSIYDVQFLKYLFRKAKAQHSLFDFNHSATRTDAITQDVYRQAELYISTVSRPTKLYAFYILLVMFFVFDMTFFKYFTRRKIRFIFCQQSCFIGQQVEKLFYPFPQKTKQTLRKSIVRCVRCIFNINTQMLLLSCCISPWNTFDVEHFNNIF